MYLKTIIIQAASGKQRKVQADIVDKVYSDGTSYTVAYYGAARYMVIGHGIDGPIYMALGNCKKMHLTIQQNSSTL